MNHENEQSGRRNLRVFSAGAALNDVGEEMYAKFLPYYAAIFLGVTPLQYGLIEGLTSAINSIFKLFTGYFTDKVGRKIPIILSYFMIALARFGLPLAGGWAGLIPFRGLRQAGRALRDPACEASIAESFPPATRGRAFGWLNTWDKAGSILGPFIGLLLLYIAAISLAGTGAAEGAIKNIWSGLKTEFPRESYIWLFLWAGLPAMASAWVVYFLLFETRAATGLFAKNINPKRTTFSVSTFISSLRPDSTFRTLGFTTLSHMILALGAVPVPMMLLYAYDKLKSGIIEGAIIAVSYSVAHLATSYAAGWFSDRVGRFRAQVVANGLLVLALLITIFIRTPLFMIIPMALYALFESIWIANRRAAIADMAKEESLGETLGSFSALYGFPALLCPILFGGIWSVFGSGAALFVMALFPVAAIFALPRK